MRFGAGFLCVVVSLLAGASIAQEVTTSPRPMPRPGVQVDPAPEAAAPSVAAAAVPTIAPKPRPRLAAEALPQTQALPPQPGMMLSLPVLRPRARPESWANAAPQAAAPVTEVAAANPPPAAQRERRGGLFGGLFQRRDREEQSERAAPVDGFVCGDRAIRGEELARISSKVQGCGIAEPVRVTQVDGIRLTTPATIDCATASALKDWINAGVRPAFGRQEVVELRVAASYICRPRNNVRGAKISEHGRGKAIDISGFILSDGRELSVAGNFNRQMRQAYRAACGIFGTTLGPGSDGYHEDHLHFDTATHRNGSYCR
jgi:hypothetical protein